MQNTERASRIAHYIARSKAFKAENGVILFPEQEKYVSVGESAEKIVLATGLKLEPDNTIVIEAILFPAFVAEVTGKGIEIIIIRNSFL